MAIMGLCDSFDHGEPQATTAAFSRARRIATTKGLEDLAGQFTIDAWTIVFNAQLAVLADLLQTYP